MSPLTQGLRYRAACDFLLMGLLLSARYTSAPFGNSWPYIYSCFTEFEPIVSTITRYKVCWKFSMGSSEPIELESGVKWYGWLLRSCHCLVVYNKSTTMKPRVAPQFKCGISTMTCLASVAHARRIGLHRQRSSVKSWLLDR